jgi:hypothetical protein
MDIYGNSILFILCKMEINYFIIKILFHKSSCIHDVLKLKLKKKNKKKVDI